MNLIKKKVQGVDQWRQTFSKVADHRSMSIAYHDVSLFPASILRPRCRFRAIRYLRGGTVGHWAGRMRTCEGSFQFYGIVDVDGDGQVTATEVEQINGAVGTLLWRRASKPNDGSCLLASTPYL